ncbi:MAG: hypothetical protein G01um10145_862 [Microgenomates group bacterium Gr01-1014_5]|nr:MAG: hypothetical protein G01um10145_862 [Microgenomates group bacterium Gr01-1014_5]
MSNLSNKSNSNGGYRNLVAYQLAVVIFDLNDLFVKSYIDPRSRTKDQMEQAARSGKQNIVEASLLRSLEGNIKLTGVARGSFGELLEDYEDFLRTRGLKLWGKDDPRVLEIRRIRVSSNKSNLSNWTNSPESFCNLMITLLHLENYLLDQLLRKLEEKFVNEGGFRENLFRRRLERKFGNGLTARK